jgi:rare lipoprotein A
MPDLESGLGRVMTSEDGRGGGMSGTDSIATAATKAVVVCTLAIAGCSSQGERPRSTWQPPVVERHDVVLPTVPGQPPASPQTFTLTGKVPMQSGVYKVGKPYTINGVTYVPAEDPGYDRVGMASWYGKEFHARRTANGEFFDMARLTAAHPTLPMPSYVYVTNLRNGRTVMVRVNDRGPYKPGRIVDLSRRTAQILGFESQGTTQVRVRFAGPAPLDPADDRRERQHLAAQPWNRYVNGPAAWGPRAALGMAAADSTGQ